MATNVYKPRGLAEVTDSVTSDLFKFQIRGQKLTDIVTGKTYTITVADGDVTVTEDV